MAPEHVECPLFMDSLPGNFADHPELLAIARCGEEAFVFVFVFCVVCAYIGLTHCLLAFARGTDQVVEDEPSVGKAEPMVRCSPFMCI